MKNGDAHIHLPHSFYGPVRCTWQYDESSNAHNRLLRSPVFSSAIHRHLIALSTLEDDSRGTHDIASFFLGDLSINENEEGQTEGSWSGDEVRVEMDDKGQAYFYWSEETIASAPSEQGLLDAMMGRLKPLQDALKPLIPRSRRKSSTD